jgi:hypothetical protein
MTSRLSSTATTSRTNIILQDSDNNIVVIVVVVAIATPQSFLCLHLWSILREVGSNSRKYHDHHSTCITDEASLHSLSGFAEMAPFPLLPPSSATAPSTSQSLVPRQLYFALPASYTGLTSGPAPGTVVGITLGSVAGVLLLLWLLQSILQNNGTTNQYIEGDTSEVVVRRERSRPPKRRRKERRPPRSEMSETSASTRPPPRREPSPRRERSERIIVEETRRTESRPAPQRERETVRETVTEETRRVPGDDTVEVLEEVSDISGPPRRSGGRSGGYRAVDPGEYAGGAFATA